MNDNPEYLKSVLRYCYTVLFLLATVLPVFSQPVPQLMGASVEADGSVLVSWEIPSGSFDGFRLFYRPTGSSIPFNSVDFLPMDNSGSIPVTDAMTKGYEVFLATYNQSGVSGSSDVLRTMILLVSNGGTGTGIARLDWNNLSVSGGEIYHIYRSDDGAGFTEVGTTVKLIYYDTLNTYCNPSTIYYRVEVRNGLVSSKSSVSSGIFKDDNLPEDPVLSYVTIVNGQAEVHWNHSPSPDVNGYMIGIREGMSFNDHTNVGYVTSFTDDLTSLPTYHDPCSEVVTYVIRALDQCGNSSSGAVNYQYPHNTILIGGNTESLCHRKATLNWNAYKNMQPPVSEYKIMRSFNGAPAIEIGAVAESGATNYSFVDDEMLEAGGSYSYYIRAVNAGNSLASESCRLLLVPDPELLTSFRFENLTVSDDSRIDLFLFGEPYPLISEIEVLRSATGPATMQQLAKTDWAGQENWWLPDISALVNETSYYYQVIALDRCGFELEASSVMRSIYLELDDLGDGNIRLGWNALEGWPGGPSSYLIYRFEDNQQVSGYPKQVPPSVLTFNDHITGAEAGVTTFYVEAESGNPAGKVSRSNKVTVEGEAEVQLPNAFRPGGVNTVYRPLVRNIDPANFSMMIYNRWGQLIYETSDYSAGWDGSSGGRNADTGIYAVIVKYRDFKGVIKSAIGSVMLFR